ncbi:hypothetical protein KC332_g2262 [Hortaea werneckii]|nr:hypothetical protein KC358_g2189 [Hortaea werneckii]KAI6850957.1 hypothetical protein KC350_g1851 [Hortaea werneckii]KAI6942496.1 hypothetical protein KC341_g2183 [Hortaea werneckii]KAI6947985.1 hypothetical protein KC348_g2194 [Hortaea werneckii]KAI6979937.1 hypothetical protein KC321_g2050 [Hortaea werneckii]
MASAAANSTLSDNAAMARGPDALQSLRDEVQEVIRPYTTADKEPPFSGDELIVMALVYTDDDALPKDRILRWIINTFKYYHDAFIDKAFQNLADDLDFQDGSGAGVFGNITGAFTEYEAPIREGQLASEKCTASLWSVTTQAARVYLRHWLEPERDGTFPFLDLPPEIRNSIYELLFTLPSSGIHVQNADGREGFDAFFLERIDEPVPYGRKWSESLDLGSPSIKKKSMNDILALLCVSKQVNKEAMPMFYMINMFHFDSYSIELQNLVWSMPKSRFEHLRKLHLDFGEHVTEWLLDLWIDITGALSAKSAGLAELRLSMTDDAWLGRGSKARQLRKAGARKSKYSCIEGIHGFADLAVVVARAKDVRWEGECALIREFVAKQVARIHDGDYTT